MKSKRWRARTDARLAATKNKGLTLTFLRVRERKWNRNSLFVQLRSNADDSLWEMELNQHLAEAWHTSGAAKVSTKEGDNSNMRG